MRKRDLARFPKCPVHSCYHAERTGVHLLAHFTPHPNRAPHEVWRLCPDCLDLTIQYIKELCLDETE